MKNTSPFPFLLVVCLFLGACAGEIDQTTRTVDKRSFSGNSCQLSNSFKELWVLDFGPSGRISGKSYTSYSSSEAFLDTLSFMDSRKINGFISTEGEIDLTIKYNKDELVNLKGSIKDKKIKGLMAGQYLDPNTGKKKFFNKLPFNFDEVVGGKMKVSTQFRNKYFDKVHPTVNYKSKIAYPEMIQHSDGNQKAWYNKAIMQSLSAKFEEIYSWKRKQVGGFSELQTDWSILSGEKCVYKTKDGKISISVPLYLQDEQHPKADIFTFNFDFLSNKFLPSPIHTSLDTTVAKTLVSLAEKKLRDQSILIETDSLPVSLHDLKHWYSDGTFYHFYLDDAILRLKGDSIILREVPSVMMKKELF